jgi:manganese oxidase
MNKSILKIKTGIHNGTSLFRILTPLFILSLMLVTACGEGSTDPGHNGHSNNGNEVGEPGPNEVYMVGQTFTPGTLEVEIGTTVRWENHSSEVHTVTSGSGGSADGIFDSGDIAPGGSFTYTFNETGTFDYFCIPHPNMTATVEVTE